MPFSHGGVAPGAICAFTCVCAWATARAARGGNDQCEREPGNSCRHSIHDRPRVYDDARMCSRQDGALHFRACSLRSCSLPRSPATLTLNSSSTPAWVVTHARDADVRILDLRRTGFESRPRAQRGMARPGVDPGRGQRTQLHAEPDIVRAGHGPAGNFGPRRASSRMTIAAASWRHALWWILNAYGIRTSH